MQNIQNTFFLENEKIPTRPIGATIPKNIIQNEGFYNIARLQVLTAVLLNIQTLWDIMLCSG